MTEWHRPTVGTKFHIDFDWWKRNKRDIRAYLREALCDQCRADYADYRGEEEIDWVDEQTGEVERVDGLWHSIRTCCSLKPDFVAASAPIVDAIFLTFVANGNRPLSVDELHELIDRRSSAMLLRILTRGPVYMGIRPAI